MHHVSIRQSLLSSFIHCRNLSSAFMIFFMRLEQMRARALDGFRADDREGPHPHAIKEVERDRLAPETVSRLIWTSV
jgi:hypothetical protein